MDSINPITGEWQEGYACWNCGGSINMMATGHYDSNEEKWICENRRSEFRYDQEGKVISNG